MIILDTNVISETQRPSPSPKVMAWMDGLDPSSTYITAITAAELVFGVNRLPDGKRRTKLSQAVSAILEIDFHERILPFDTAAALYFGPLAAEAEKAGKRVSFADGAIAAIARANKSCPIATRDERPFFAMGIEVIDPWAEG